MSEAAGEIFHARMEPSGRQFRAPADQTLVHSAAQAGIEIPTSCRNGTCRTCIGQLVAGRVSYRIEWPGLLPEEKAANYILPCVAFPASDVTFMVESALAA